MPVGIDSRLEVGLVGFSGRAGRLRLTGCVTSLDGGEHVEHSLERVVSSLEEAEEVGERLARVLMDNGAQAILDDITKDREHRAGEAEAEEAVAENAV